MNIVNTIIIFSHLPILVVLLFCIYQYRKMEKALKVFSWFIFLSGIVQGLSLTLFFMGKNNMPVLHFYVLLGLPILILFYKTVLANYVSTKIMWGIIICFVPYTIVNSLLVENIYRFNSNALVVESITITTLSLFTFIFFLNDSIKETEIKDKLPLSWINTGLFIYYLSCLLIFYFGDRLLFHFSPSLSGMTWIFHSFFSIVMYTCFLLGLFKWSKTLHS